jgi:hypothetical protein
MTVQKMEQNQQLTIREIRETISALSSFNKLHQSEIVKEKAKAASLDLDESYCPITGEKLYKVLESGYHGYLKPHGKCKDCNKYYAYSEFDISDGVSQPRWPMRFIGVTCKVCKSEQNLD